MKTNHEDLVAELKLEAEQTRIILERVPENRLGWRPHPKSMSLGQLALHIAGLPQGIASLLQELERAAPVVPLTEATSADEILKLLEESVEIAAQAISDWGEEGLDAIWRMTVGGEVVVEAPRKAMVRTLMLNHWYHHRGQLTVYLRLLEVPVPGMYGPSADEAPLIAG